MKIPRALAAALAALAAAAATMVPVAAQQTPSTETVPVSEAVPLPEAADRMSAPVPGGPELGAGFVLEGVRLAPGVASLGWDDVAAATGYELMFRSPDGWVPLSEREPAGGVIVEFEGSSAVVGGLPENVSQWWFAVRARNVHGLSQWSASAAVESPQGAAPEPLFDPFTSPTRSGIDLERLREAVATITPGEADCSAVPALEVEGVTVVDPPVSLDDPAAALTVAEVVRVAGGCLVVEHVALAGRTVAQVRTLLAADASVHAVGEPLRGLAVDHNSNVHKHTGSHHNDSGLAETDDVKAVQWHLPQPTMNLLWDSWNDDADAQVIVAVLDTGVDITHPDFTENEDDPLVANTNSRIVGGRGCHVIDDDGHGTQMAGIIAAELGGGHVAGVAPDAKILPLRAIRRSGCSATPAPLTPPEAVAAAVNGGARVINMSIRDTGLHDQGDVTVGGIGIPSRDTWELTLRAAAMLGVVAVASAGNCGVAPRGSLSSGQDHCRDQDARQRPAAYQDVIAVAAIDSDGFRTDTSTANELVDVAAPGEGILTTHKDCASTHCVKESDGTSPASAYVSGVVALMLNRYPGATVGQVRRALEASARHPRGVVRDDEYGHGIVDPAAAIAELRGLVNALGPVGAKGGFRSLSAGARHTCGVRDNGAVSCWGLDSVVDETPDVAFASLSSSPGADFMCGLRLADDALVCWGDVPAEVTVDVAGRRVLDADGAAALDGRFESVVVGDRHVCGVRPEGWAMCWGDNSSGQSEGSVVGLGSSASVTALAAGGEHTCAVTHLTGLRCWGKGQGPAQPPNSSFVIARQIAAGAVNTCVIDADDELECFGSHSRGVLGVPAGEFVSLDAGSHHMCAVSGAGRVRCWGDSADGRLAAPTGRYRQIAVGDRHGCALSVLGRVACWGHNGDGQAPGQGQLSALSLTAGGADLLSGRFSPSVASYAVRTGETRATLRAVAERAGTHSRICTGAGRRRSCESLSHTSPVALADGERLTVTARALFGFGETRTYRVDISEPSGLTSLSLVPAGSGPQCTPQCAALVLEPPFDPGVTEYRTVAAADVSQVTVAYRADGRTVTIAPADADRAAGGHQVGLRTDRGFASVSAGEAHSCGLKTGGSVVCWGSDDSGQSSPPAGRFVSFDAGDDHGCGIRPDQTVVCWGDKSHGKAAAPAGSFTQVSAGGFLSCGIKTDRTVACWGHWSWATPTGEFTQVSVGGLHACGIRTDGSTVCWGSNADGRSQVPTGSFTQVSAGREHSCGVKSDQTVVCWGYNFWGQTDAPSGSFVEVQAGWATSCGRKADGSVECWGDAPVALAGPFAQISAGYFHACGLNSGGDVRCWGLRNFGQVSAPAGSFTQVSAGRFHSCGVRADRSVVCWGGNSAGQSDAPAGSYMQVSAGASRHSCGVKTDATVVCWGSNDRGQSDAPSGKFLHVSAGWDNTCGVKTDGSVVCWGATSVPPPGSFTSVSAHGSLSCGLQAGGGADCWGYNPNVRPGDLVGSFVSVSAGANHACAVRAGGAVVCVGSNGSGQSDGPAGRFTAVSAGYKHSCALTTVGSVECWGQDRDGQSDPPSGTLTQVSVGWYHSCGLTADGAAVCWGGRSAVLEPAAQQTVAVTVGRSGSQTATEYTVDIERPVPRITTLTASASSRAVQGTQGSARTPDTESLPPPGQLRPSEIEAQNRIDEILERSRPRRERPAGAAPAPGGDLSSDPQRRTSAEQTLSPRAAAADSPAAGSARLARQAECPASTSGSAVIADPVLRSAVEAALGKTAGGAVSVSELAGLTELRLPRAGGEADAVVVTDLSGLEGASGLRVLGIAANQLSGLAAVGGLGGLEALYAYGNEVSDVSALAGLSGLATLWASGNEVTDVAPLGAMPGLGYVDVRHNRVSDVSPLDALAGRAVVHARPQQGDVAVFADGVLAGVVRDRLGLVGAATVTKDALGGLTKLVHTATGTDRIGDLSGFEHASGLVELRLYHHGVGDLSPLVPLERLERLTLMANGALDVAQIGRLRSLRLVNLVNNGIEDISALRLAPTVEELLLDSNRISDISPLGAATGLWRVELSHNRIADITPISALTRLRRLGLSANPIGDWSPVSGLGSLQVLLASRAGLADLEPLSGLSSLIHLSAARNNITSLQPLAALTRLQSLYLADNQIASLEPLRHHTALHTLYVAGNQIADFTPLSGLPRLTVHGRGQQNPPTR